MKSETIANLLVEPIAINMNKDKGIKKIVSILLPSFLFFIPVAYAYNDDFARMQQESQLREIKKDLDWIKRQQGAQQIINNNTARQDAYNSPAAIAEREQAAKGAYWAGRLTALRKAYANERKSWDRAYKIEKKKWNKTYKIEKKNGASKSRLDQITNQSNIALEQITATKKAKLDQLRANFEKVRKEMVFNLYGVRE